MASFLPKDNHRFALGWCPRCIDAALNDVAEYLPTVEKMADFHYSGDRDFTTIDAEKHGSCSGRH